MVVVKGGNLSMRASIAGKRAMQYALEEAEELGLQKLNTDLAERFRNPIEQIIFVFDTRVREAKMEELIEVIKLQGGINSPCSAFIRALKKYLFCRCKNDVNLRDRNLEDEKNALKEEIDAITALYEDFNDLMQLRLIQPVGEEDDNEQN
jgi:hypothetical protein